MTQKTIFVVDDEESIARTTALILSINGFQAVSFNNPLEALEKALEQGPDLVICDGRMPELAGIDLIKRLQEKRPECKAFLFSGDPSTLESASEKGISPNVRILAKPLSPLMLVEQVTDFLR